MGKPQKSLKPVFQTKVTDRGRKNIEKTTVFPRLVRRQEQKKDPENGLDIEQVLMENVFDHDIES